MGLVGGGGGGGGDGGGVVFTSGDLELNAAGDSGAPLSPGLHLQCAIKASPLSLEVDNPLNCLTFRKAGTRPWPLVERQRQRI